MLLHYGRLLMLSVKFKVYMLCGLRVLHEYLGPRLCASVLMQQVQ